MAQFAGWWFHGCIFHLTCDEDAKLIIFSGGVATTNQFRVIIPEFHLSLSDIAGWQIWNMTRKHSHFEEDADADRDPW